MAYLRCRRAIFAVLYVVLLLRQHTYASGLAVQPNHPRILFTPSIKNALLAKKNANDPTWQALKTRADTLSRHAILKYTYPAIFDEPDNTIFYDYYGEGWYTTALPLALAYQMTGDTRYSSKLLELADEMVAAQSRPENTPPTGLPPVAGNNYYPSRYVCPVIAIIYDWCYEQLSTTRKTQMVALMNNYFDDMRANAYQRNDHIDGNHGSGPFIAAAYMGYATAGDNPRAQEMIDYARIRFDGTPSSLVAPDSIPVDNIAQIFEGGYKPEIARDFNGPNLTGAPFKGGFHTQGMGAYGSQTFDRYLDYMLTVQTATGEDLFAQHPTWAPSLLRAQKHSLLSNHFEIDRNGDWAGTYGAVIFHDLPLRLAYVLAAMPDGPVAQHFYYSELAPSSLYPEFPDEIYQGFRKPKEWESFYFGNATRPSAESALPPFYSGFGPAYPQGAMTATNGALPYFIMRSDWGPNATWASVHMGAAWYNDHQSADAGQINIRQGDDYLLVDASNWHGLSGTHGLVGDPYTEADNTASANTLFVRDFGDFQRNTQAYLGGQGVWGKDEVIAAEQNSAFSYVRSNLSSAYNNGGDPANQVNRPLDYFYRSFVYLRSANLFFVYDQAKTIASTNPRGPYLKHLRWHFPNRPTVTGKTVRVDQGVSRLYLDTLLPSSPTINAVDESNNPDAALVPTCFDAFGCNSGTWRVEVSDTANPLVVPFLTVIQPGSTSMAPMSSTLITSLDSKMIGAGVTQTGGVVNVVFFNNQAGPIPSPITSTSYNFVSSQPATHTLCGFVPNARYDVSVSASNVTITQNNSGAVMASPAGVLQFASSCSYSISSTSQAFTANGGVGSVNVTASTGCSWTAASNDAWITITGGNAGSGNGTVSYSVAANNGAASRTGTLSIAGQTLTITEAGAVPSRRRP